MEKLYEIVLLLLLIACAVSVNLTKSLLHSVIIFMSYSSIMCLLWILMESPDLAITEAAVGAGISGILFLVTLKKLRQMDGGGENGTGGSSKADGKISTGGNSNADGNTGTDSGMGGGGQRNGRRRTVSGETSNHADNPVDNHGNNRADYRLKTIFFRWLDGEMDLMASLPDAAEGHDLPRKDWREIEEQAARDAADQMVWAGPAVKKFERAGYRILAALCCAALMGVFLYMAAHITRFGAENPRTAEVARRYVEDGLAETGAVNMVAGMILDYRAFDTLGESHVLFTALLCVMILLRRDSKNMRTAYEDYYQIGQERLFPTYRDPILRRVGLALVPCILVYGIYVVLNGQNSPGGGFSGGAVLGAGLMVFASAFGDRAVDRFLTLRRFQWTAFCALSFYSFAKGYVFFTGANGLENHIPRGTPGAILSGGLILPLDIAVGLVVGCTMFGFYSLFRRGIIGGKQGKKQGEKQGGEQGGNGRA